jgi:hypothetical protein
MTMPALPGLDDLITPTWLTTALQMGVVLPQGAVRQVTTRTNDAFNSAALHLTATYTPRRALDCAPAPLSQTQSGSRLGARSRRVGSQFLSIGRAIHGGSAAVDAVLPGSL